MNLKVFYIATICLSLFTQLPCQAFFEKDLHLLTQCCPKRFIDTMNMRLLWTTTPSKLFWTPFIPLQLALAEV